MTAAVSYYLPAGRWTSFLGGHVVDGGGWRTETHGYMSLPLMVRSQQRHRRRRRRNPA